MSQETQNSQSETLTGSGWKVLQAREFPLNRTIPTSHHDDSPWELGVMRDIYAENPGTKGNIDVRPCSFGFHFSNTVAETMENISPPYDLLAQVTAYGDIVEHWKGDKYAAEKLIINRVFDLRDINPTTVRFSLGRYVASLLVDKGQSYEASRMVRHYAFPEPDYLVSVIRLFDSILGHLYLEGDEPINKGDGEYFCVTMKPTFEDWMSTDQPYHPFSEFIAEFVPAIQLTNERITAYETRMRQAFMKLAEVFSECVDEFESKPIDLENRTFLKHR